MTNFSILLDQAIYEIDELLICSGDESEDDMELSESRPLFEHLVQELKALHAEVTGGTHVFGSGVELKFMPLVQQWCDRIPFRVMFEALNRSHLQGL